MQIPEARRHRAPNGRNTTFLFRPLGAEQDRQRRDVGDNAGRRSASHKGRPLDTRFPFPSPRLLPEGPQQ